MTGRSALLEDRGLVRVAGEDAEKFLHGLVTNDVAGLAAGRGVHAAVLTPQGKILFDLMIARLGADGALGLECVRARVPDVVKRLGFYKLRAKVAIEDASAAIRVGAAWDGEVAVPAGTIAFADPRAPGLGRRLWLPGAAAFTPSASADDYHRHRIALGIPEGGRDYQFGDAFPHEAMMDLLHGVDFQKGCYVGQEVVSRMEHRGTARKRIVPVSAAGPLPPAGTPVRAGEAEIGTMGASVGAAGLAMIRLDRAKEAVEKGVALTAGGLALTLRRPEWAPFPVPGAP